MAVSVITALWKTISYAIPKLTLTDLSLSHEKLFRHMTLISTYAITNYNLH